MAVGLADGRNLTEKPSGDLRKWGWNWWEASLFSPLPLFLSLSLFLFSLRNDELSVRCSFKILFRSRNRRLRLVLGITMSTNWRHVPKIRVSDYICYIANKKIDCVISSDFRRFLKCLQPNLRLSYICSFIVSKCQNNSTFNILLGFEIMYTCSWYYYEKILADKVTYNSWLRWANLEVKSNDKFIPWFWISRTSYRLFILHVIYCAKVWPSEM